MNDQRLHPPGADCAGTSPDAAGAFSHDALADELEALRGKDTDTLGRWLFDNRDAVLAALRRMTDTRRPSAWQTMDSAPKDGTQFLCVRAGEGEIEITEWCVMERSHFELIEGDLYRKVQDEPYTFWNNNGDRATRARPRRLWPETEAKVRTFMVTYRPHQKADAA